tara:strand:- start:79 stop:276 length:198 start_codon:yes stop_codon:yes gene_type:complete
MNILTYTFQLKKDLTPENIQEFVIPKPTPGESQSEYITRCMDAIGAEDKPRQQLLAICNTSYTKK